MQLHIWKERKCPLVSTTSYLSIVSQLVQCHLDLCGSALELQKPHLLGFPWIGMCAPESNRTSYGTVRLKWCTIFVGRPFFITFNSAPTSPSADIRKSFRINWVGESVLFLYKIHALTSGKSMKWKRILCHHFFDFLSTSYKDLNMSALSTYLMCVLYNLTNPGQAIYSTVLPRDEVYFSGIQIIRKKLDGSIVFPFYKCQSVHANSSVALTPLQIFVHDNICW